MKVHIDCGVEGFDCLYIQDERDGHYLGAGELESIAQYLEEWLNSTRAEE